MAAELQDVVVFANAIRHFLGMSDEYAREYVARLPLEPAELLVRALGRLGWWLPDETLSHQERLSKWLFRDDVTRIDFEGGQEVHRPEPPQDRLTDAINGLAAMATSSDVPRDSCAATEAFVKNVRLTLKRKELPFGLPIARTGNPADFQFDPLTLIRFDGECLCQSLNSAGERLNLQPHPIDWTPSNGDPHQTVDRAFQDLGELMDCWIDDLKSAIQERGERLPGKVQRDPARSVRRDPEFVEERLRILKTTWEDEIEWLTEKWRTVAAGNWAGNCRISADTYLRFGLVTFTTSGRSSPKDATVAAWHPIILDYLKTLGVDPSPVDDLFRRFLKGDLTDKRAVRREAKRAFLQLDIAIERAGQQYEDGESEIGPSGNAIAELKTISPSPGSEPEFVFRPDGDGYFIRGFGDEGHFSAKGAKGFDDLFRLVKSANKPILMADLEGDPSGLRSLVEGQSYQPAFDSEGAALLKAELSKIQVEIAEIDPNSGGADKEREELERTRGEILKEFKRNSGLRGRPRNLNDRDRNRMKSNISSRIRDVCRRYEARFPKLFEHFRTSTGASDSEYYVYSPTGQAINWITD